MTPAERQDRLKVLLRAQRARNALAAEGFVFTAIADQEGTEKLKTNSSKEQTEERKDRARAHLKLLPGSIIILIWFSGVIWLAWMAGLLLIFKVIGGGIILLAWLLSLLEITDAYGDRG